jgi:hypothetical protein
LLFKAQRLQAGQRDPEVISIMDLDPSCIFVALDNNALMSTAVNAANSIVNRWTDQDVSKPWEYNVNGHLFVAVSAAGIPHTTALEPLNAMVIVTRAHSHVLGWTLVGPKDDLARIAQACTLQFDGQTSSPLLPVSQTP